MKFSLTFGFAAVLLMTVTAFGQAAPVKPPQHAPNSPNAAPVDHRDHGRAVPALCNDVQLHEQAIALQHKIAADEAVAHAAKAQHGANSPDAIAKYQQVKAEVAELNSLRAKHMADEAACQAQEQQERAALQSQQKNHQDAQNRGPNVHQNAGRGFGGRH